MATGIPTHLGTLGRVEQLLWDAYPHGAVVECATLPDHEREVRGEVVAALLLGAVEPEPGRVPALRLSGARVVGPVDLRGGDIGCELSMVECELTDTPVLSQAFVRTVRLNRCRLPGLRGELTRFDGGLNLIGSTISGSVRLTRAQVTGELTMDRAHITARDDEAAFIAGGLIVEGGFFARGGFVAEGGLRMPGARVDGGVSLDGATLRNPDGTALFADNFVTTTMNCAGLTADGGIRLVDVRISGDLNLTGVQLSAPGDVALHLGRAQIGHLILKPAAPVVGKVQLTYGQYGVISDDPDTWPAELNLNGTVYAAVQMSGRPLAVVDRIDWVSRTRDGYRPQPYEQLAAYYRSVGHDELARRVLLAKERRHRRTLSRPRRAMSHFLDWTVGYGYRPARALLWLLALAVVGSVVFALDRPEATGDPSASFNAVVYALDMLLPVSVFDQRGSWQASGASAWVGYALRAAGWLLTTAVIAGLTRVLNRR